MEPGLIIGIFVVIAIAIRLAAGSADYDRIEEYIRQKGWELVDKSWDPLGPGWFGEQNARIYQVVFRDKEGNLRRAHVKTSMFSGVYLTNDEVVERARVEPRKGLRGDELKKENERLKARVRELERKAGEGKS